LEPWHEVGQPLAPRRRRGWGSAGLLRTSFKQVKLRESTCLAKVLAVVDGIVAGLALEEHVSAIDKV